MAQQHHHGERLIALLGSKTFIFGCRTRRTYCKTVRMLREGVCVQGRDPAELARLPARDVLVQQVARGGDLSLIHI